jgi:hypothetical protein
MEEVQPQDEAEEGVKPLLPAGAVTPMTTTNRRGALPSAATAAPLQPAPLSSPSLSATAEQADAEVAPQQRLPSSIPPRRAIPGGVDRSVTLREILWGLPETGEERCEREEGERRVLE